MKTDSRNYLATVIGVAVLVALDIILTRFLSIQTQFLRIGFGILPIAVAGIAYGPFWGGVAGAVGDVLGMLIWPSGAFFPGFTLTAALTGIVFGILLYKKYSLIKLIIACVIVCLVLNLIMDSLWLSIMYGSGYLTLLPVRAVKCIINIPIYVILVEILWNRVLVKIPQLNMN